MEAPLNLASPSSFSATSCRKRRSAFKSNIFFLRRKRKEDFPENRKIDEF